VCCCHYFTLDAVATNLAYLLPHNVQFCHKYADSSLRHTAHRLRRQLTAPHSTQSTQTVDCATQHTEYADSSLRDTAHRVRRQFTAPHSTQISQIYFQNVVRFHDSLLTKIPPSAQRFSKHPQILRSLWCRFVVQNFTDIANKYVEYG
jgi:hypothetical protein